MATATKSPGARRKVPRQAAVATEPSPITFRLFEDNGGRYNWTVLGPDGNSLARSTPYATLEEATEAVQVVCDGAGSARIEAGTAADLA